MIALSPHVLRSLHIDKDDEKMLWLGIEEQQQGSTYRYSPVPNIPPPYEEPDMKKKHLPRMSKLTRRLNPEEEEEEPPPDEYEDYPPGLNR